MAETAKTEDVITQALETLHATHCVGEMISWRGKHGLVEEVTAIPNEKHKKLRVAFFPSQADLLKWRKRGDNSQAATATAPADEKAMFVTNSIQLTPLWLNGFGFSVPEILEVLTNDSIIRTDLIRLPRSLLKSIIREHTTKAAYPKAPLVVNPELRKEFGLAEELSAELAEVASKHTKKRKRSDDDDTEPKEKKDKQSATDEPAAVRTNFFFWLLLTKSPNFVVTEASKV